MRYDVFRILYCYDAVRLQDFWRTAEQSIQIDRDIPVYIL